MQYNSLQIFIYRTFTGTCSQLYDVTHDSEVMADQTISLSFYPKPRCRHLVLLSGEDMDTSFSMSPVSSVYELSWIYLLLSVFALSSIYTISFGRLLTVSLCTACLLYIPCIRHVFFSSRCILEILSNSF